MNQEERGIKELRQIVERSINYISSLSVNIEKMQGMFQEWVAAYCTPPNALKELLETYKPKEEEQIKFDMTFSDAVRAQPFFIDAQLTAQNIRGMVKDCPEMFKNTWIYKQEAVRRCNYLCNGPLIERASLKYDYQNRAVMKIRDHYRELYKIKD